MYNLNRKQKDLVYFQKPCRNVFSPHIYADNDYNDHNLNDTLTEIISSDEHDWLVD